jgi:predicted RNA-binding protein YlqC (UPF0109 family)
MEELLRYIVNALVDDKDSVKIVRRDEDRVVVFEVSVAPNEVGKIIGKNGKIAQAIRSILHSASHDEDKKYILKIK